MNLAEILKKTKSKSEQIVNIRNPPSIATEDRPYSGSEDSKLFNRNTSDDDKDRSQIIRKKVATNCIQSGNKVATNCIQSGNKVATNRIQSGNKVATNKQKILNYMTLENKNWQQSGDQSGNKTGNKVATKWQQSDNKVVSIATFSELVGLQRKIVLFLCKECQNLRSKTTGAMTLEHIAVTLKEKASSVKTTIQRLEKKGCLIRTAFKDGRGGWSKYELPDNIYHDVLRKETENKLKTNCEQTDNKVATEPVTQPATNTSSSSSLFNNITTTTELSEQWNFDISPYAKFGFTNTQLKQLISLNNISAENVEQSLIEFNYDLNTNKLPVIKTGKINFLMGLLRLGHSYVSEGFQNEQEATISEMANRAEVKRKKLANDKFVVWEASLSDEEKKEIENKVPLSLRVLFRTEGMNSSEIKSWLFNYYLKSISIY